MLNLFTDMKVNGQTPQRTDLYKFGKILPLMAMTAVPRLVSLSFIYSMANSSTWKFYTVVTTIFFTLYGLCYWVLQHFLKKKDSGLKGIGFLGFFTSIISPCLIGTFYSPFFMLTSLISALLHSVFLGQCLS